MASISKKTFSLILLLLLLLFVVVFPIVKAATTTTTKREAFACGEETTEKAMSFCEVSLGTEERVRDLIGRLTLREKVRLMVNNAAGIERVGMRGYEWWSEGLHGVSNVGPGTRFGGPYPSATSFPQVISTVASFNTSLWESIGRVVSDEARAMYNGGYGGLTYWSPNVNIFRDPRWGRGQETPGEDPFLVGSYAVSYVKGLQGNHPTRLKLAACCKHFTAYDLDNWNGVDRFHFNAKVSKQDMEDTFDVPFKMCVKEGRVASVMCSYNQVNGVPTCADPNLLNTTLRSSWGLNGYIVSDCDSVGVFYDSQHYTSTPEEAAADAIKAGLDLDCGPFLALHSEEAVKKGVLKEEDINSALRNTLRVQMRLGMFDGDLTKQPYGKLGPSDVCTAKSQELAHEAAVQGIVLLKNRRGVLPLSPSHHRTVAVIGPNSDVNVTMIGNYAGIACGYTSPLGGITKYTNTIHQKGCLNVGCGSDKLFHRATQSATQSDATVLVMGLDQSIEAEFKDRTSLLLPGRQQELVSKIVAASKGPVILVLMSGGPIDVSFAQNDDRIGAILWAGYPGQAGGAAIADVLFGKTNPGGKLPMTWYPEEYISNLAMTSMEMRPDPSKNYPGRTYRFYSGPVVYPFGHGLTYTRFHLSLSQPPKLLSIPLHGHRRNPNDQNATTGAVRVTRVRCDGVSLSLHVDVRNVGPTDGTHTLLVFSTPPPGKGVWAPRRQLAGFEKVHVASGSGRRVRVDIHVCKRMSVVDRGGVRRIPLGVHSLTIGDDVSHSVTLQPLSVGTN